MKTTNVGDALLKRYPNFLRPGRPNLTELKGVYLANALGIESQEPEFNDSNILSSELENPYPPPEFPTSYNSGYLLPVKIGIISSDFFCIHFDHQVIHKMF